MRAQVVAFVDPLAVDSNMFVHQSRYLLLFVSVVTFVLSFDDSCFSVLVFVSDLNLGLLPAGSNKLVMSRTPNNHCSITKSDRDR